MIEDPELLRLFKVESGEHLARLDDGLLRLEKTPADQALLEEVFRESHSLKGAARMLGLAKIEAVAHDLESNLNAARKGEAPLTPEAIERMTAALGGLRVLVNTECGQSSRAASETPPLSGTESGGHTKTESVPPPPVIPQTTIPAPHSEPVPQPESRTPPAAFRIETVRVETRQLDELLTQTGELAVIQGRVQHRLALMDELLEQWATLKLGRREKRPDAFERFGSLLRKARDALYEDGVRLEATVNLLEDQVHTVRLLPLATVFALFPRMAHDLAKEQGKEVELMTEGGDITVDKRILEEMKDPLIHLVRNAIDHGIEPPSERERLGKPCAGQVRLSAARENGGVRIEVRDDGRGLDLDAIRRTAARRGLHDEETLAAMTPTQLQQLILLPGFSTSEHVTELSGRGVGLDVVRVNVERLKGGIHLESDAGRGLSVLTRLPLSLATSRLLLASANGRLYGLPVEFVLSSRRVREEELFTLEGRTTVKLDGQPLIAARLADLLELPPGAEAPEWMACIVLQAEEVQLGLLVDELLAEEEVVPKPLGAPLMRVRNVSALATLASGEICAVLNPADLLRSAHKPNAGFGTALRPPSIPQSKPAVLLVEDSALVRAMEKRILEDAGYQVTAAVDGVDALNALSSRPFAAVVSDIVMPNMDGLTLTLRIRAELRYRELPVVLVTTLASDEDKRRGLEAGANAYIPKPSFDQRVLLDTLNRLIAR